MEDEILDKLVTESTSLMIDSPVTDAISDMTDSATHDSTTFSTEAMMPSSIPSTAAGSRTATDILSSKNNQKNLFHITTYHCPLA